MFAIVMCKPRLVCCGCCLGAKGGTVCLSKRLCLRLTLQEKRLVQVVVWGYWPETGWLWTQRRGGAVQAQKGVRTAHVGGRVKVSPGCVTGVRMTRPAHVGGKGWVMAAHMGGKG